MTRATLLYASMLLLAQTASEVRAQSIDYGVFEKIFGEPVTTSATGTPQRASDAPVTLEIVTAEQIRRTGAYDIPGVLRHVLGVDFQQWGNDQADISVRGYDQAFAQRVLVLIDGRQVYADYYSFTPWSALPVELGDIRQIEVVLGPSCALFGFNAVAGVINIVTYNPLYDEVDAVSVQGGTQNLRQGSAVTTVQFPDAAVRLSAGARSDDDFSTAVPEAISQGVQRLEENRRAVDLDALMKLGGGQMRIQASHSSADQNDVNSIYTEETARFTTNSVRAQWLADLPTGLLQAGAYENWYDERAPLLPDVELQIANRVLVAQLQDLFKPAPRHTVRLAFEYRDDSAGTSPESSGRVFYHVYSASGMWEWRLSRSWVLTNALRWDDLQLGRDGSLPTGYPFVNSDWDQNLRKLSYNSGLLWKIGEDDTVRLTSARGVLLPNLLDLGALLFTSAGLAVTGTPLLRPTVVQNYEASWNHELEGLAASLTARLFYQTTRSVQSPVGGFIQDGGPVYFLPSTIGDSQARGVELGLKGTFLEKWRWGVNARYEHVVDSFNAGAEEGMAYVDFQHVTPATVVNTHVGWSSGHWEADLYAQYDSHASNLVPVMVGANSMLVPVGAFVAVDGRLAYEFASWGTVAISGQNLGHSSQRQTSGPSVERRIIAAFTARL